MKDEQRLDRRAFTARSLLAALGGVTVTVSGCGGGGGGTPSGGSGPTGPSPMPTDGVTGVVSANHGHTATISSAELSDGAMVTLDITGQSDHPHTVDLTAAEVVAIAGGDRVVARSSNEDGHFHEVTFN